MDPISFQHEIIFAGLSVFLVIFFKAQFQILAFAVNSVSWISCFVALEER